MVRDWEATFRSWSNPPSDTEESRCENAERMIRSAIANDAALSEREIHVFTQGSYRHNTNVRLNSDVDIAVCLLDTFFSNYPDTNVREAIKSRSGITKSDYLYKTFKSEVEVALVNKFGRKNVTRGNKAFDIHANSYRVDADVVACFEHRRYTGDKNRDGSYFYHSGTEFLPDDGGSIVNWPEQNAQNGIEKNNATSKRYKYTIRILKRLRNEMQEADIEDANNIASFLIESLVWNVPNEEFESSQYYDIVRNVLRHTFNNTITDATCKEWGEVNELKYLFRSAQPWTRRQAHSFLSAAWDYIGYE